MIDFYSDGITVGVAFSGWTMVVLIVYIGFIFLNWSSTKVTLIKKIIILYKVRKRVKSKIPFWWKFSNVLYSFLLTHKTDGRYVIPIEVKCDLSKSIYSKKTFTVKTFLHMDSNGIHEDTDMGTDYLLSMIKQIDTNNNIDYKQMYRDKKLKDLGI